jgi:oligo-1,6-glucosidase
MRRAVLDGRDAVTIGEAWSATPDTALDYCGRDRGALSMVFQFAHVTEGWDPVHGKWRPRPFDLVGFKRVLNDWQAALADDGWNALFLSNHDLPRQVSRYGDDGRWRVRSAKLLATAMHLMRGTPFVYQGEEIGMTNARFVTVNEFRDLETLRLHAERTAEGMTEADFVAGANANGRDNARIPMQWTAGPQAGFTDGVPWIGVNDNHATVNVAADRADPDGVLAHYRTLIALRRDLRIVSHGRYRPFAEDHPAVMAYTREDGAHRLSVVANFTGDAVAFDVPAGMEAAGRCVSCNVAPRDAVRGTIELAPWEAFAVLRD